ncbi:hypothetical protein ACIQOV_33185 [Kitasatospora sp. NPDC091257]|uniref:hypothetical protein n=1 Tax=Kitasatospora sp. NPDC091257 TaxID=3364084 RepID=UPI0038018629
MAGRLADIARSGVGLAVKGFMIWHADQLRSMLDADRDVRHAFPSLLSVADVLAMLGPRTTGPGPLEAEESIPGGAPGPLTRHIDQLTDPFELEVHRAIAPSTDEIVPALPAYVEREHDLVLAEVAARAVAGSSSLAVLVGDSSTGKTRSCWELIHRLPPGWRLWHPISPSPAEALLADLPHVPPRTVIWLNDLQQYLLTPPGGVGSRAAAALRALLRREGAAPVLVLATIWPREWNELTCPPGGLGQDPHAQARALLRGHDIEVPDSFNASDLTRLRTEAAGDSRLRRALERAESGMITQYLAGAPVILERYRHARPAARALMDAAVDARRLGLGSPIPEELLERAVPGYLTDHQWNSVADDWFSTALAYATAPCLGAPGPLTRIRPRPGDAAPERPRYRLADYLEQSGRAQREDGAGTASLWDALVLHAPEADRPALAAEAADRFLYGPAVRLRAEAVANGDAAAARAVAELLAEAGFHQEATDHYVTAAYRGDIPSIHDVARGLEDTGAEDMAAHVWEMGVDLGDDHSREARARALIAQDEADAALPYLADAVTGGSVSALLTLADLMADTRGPRSAAEWIQRQAAENEGSFARAAGTWLLRHGFTDDCYALLRKSIAVGSDPDLPWITAFLSGTREERRIDELLHHAVTAESETDSSGLDWLAEQSLVEPALEWLRGRTASDALDSPGTISRVLWHVERHEEGIAHLIGVLDPDDTSQLRHLASWLKTSGRFDEAYELDLRAAEQGHPDAMSGVAQWLETRGHHAEALREYQRAVRATARAVHTSRHLSVWAIAALLERKFGAPGEVISDVPDPMDRAIHLLRAEAGPRAAEEWLLRQAEGGHPSALGRAVELLASEGMEEKADRLRRYGIQPGGLLAAPWSPPVLDMEALD